MISFVIITNSVKRYNKVQKSAGKTTSTWPIKCWNLCCDLRSNQVSYATNAVVLSKGCLVADKLSKLCPTANEF